MIDNGIAQAGSDFQKDVLTRAKQSRQISEADWKEANTRYEKCMREAGLDVEVIYEGSRVLVQSNTVDPKSGERSEADKKADLDCYKKTSAHINEVYFYLNSGGEAGNLSDHHKVILKCLKDKNLVPADTTLEQFEAKLKEGNGEFTGEGQDKQNEFAKCWEEATG